MFKPRAYKQLFTACKCMRQPLKQNLGMYCSDRWMLEARCKNPVPIFLPLTSASLNGGGCPGCPGLTPFAQPAPRQSYAPMARKPAPSSHKPPRQWSQVPVTLIYHWKNEGGRDGGKRMIQRLNTLPRLLAQITKKQ